MTAQVIQPKNRTQERVNTSRIWLAGLLGIIASVIANLVMRAVLFAALPLPADFPPLQVGAIAFLTTIGTFLAAVVYGLIVRFTRRPVTIFRWVALVALILSILPNVALMVDPTAIPFPFPGASSLAFGVLIVFHVVAAFVSVAVLTTFSREN